MSWGLAILLIIIFICVTLLIFIKFPATPYFIETYFIVVILILFIILLFTIDFDNPISTTVYINKDNSSKTTTIVYDIPYNDDTQYSNLFSVSFVGVYGSAGINNPINKTASTDSMVINYDIVPEGMPETLPNVLDAIEVKKLPNRQIEVKIKNGIINGFLTLNLICTGSQNIKGKFEEVSRTDV